MRDSAWMKTFLLQLRCFCVALENFRGLWSLLYSNKMSSPDLGLHLSFSKCVWCSKWQTYAVTKQMFLFVLSSCVILICSCSGYQKRKHQRSALHTLYEGNPQGTNGFPHKWPTMRRMCSCHDNILLDHNVDLVHHIVFILCLFFHFNRKPQQQYVWEPTFQWWTSATRCNPWRPKM